MISIIHHSTITVSFVYSTGEGSKVQANLQSRLDRLKTAAMMKSREHMGPVELVNWWTLFRCNIQEIEKFEDLDAETKAQILEWESHPYKIIGS